MNPRTKRVILRWLHIVFAIPVLGYIYSPFALLPTYAFIARYIAVPVLTLSGFAMWIASTPKKAVLIPVGTFLILFGLVGPLPLTPAPSSTPPATISSVASLAVNAFHVCFFVGLVCAIIGVIQNRKLKPQPAVEPV